MLINKYSSFAKVSLSKEETFRCMDDPCNEKFYRIRVEAQGLSRSLCFDDLSISDKFVRLCIVSLYTDVEWDQVQRAEKALNEKREAVIDRLNEVTGL